jgi:hypothetical protein
MLASISSTSARSPASNSAGSTRNIRHAGEQEEDEDSATRSLLLFECASNVISAIAVVDEVLDMWELVDDSDGRAAAPATLPPDDGSDLLLE